jgi:hypothetical protein
MRDNEKGTFVLIDVAISGDGSVVKNEAEKILKYEHLMCVETRIVYEPLVRGVSAVASWQQPHYLFTYPDSATSSSKPGYFTVLLPVTYPVIYLPARLNQLVNYPRYNEPLQYKCSTSGT